MVGLNYRQYLTVIALLGAIYAANGSGDLLAYMGIAYYILCIIALLTNYQRAGLMLWAAVGVHIGLTGFALWRWQAMGIIPCHYCLLAAGCALVAAVFYARPKLVVFPLILMVSVACAWPYVFEAKNSPAYVQVENELNGPNDINAQKAEITPPANPNTVDQETKTSPDKSNSAQQTNKKETDLSVKTGEKSGQPAAAVPASPGITAMEPVSEQQKQPETIPGKVDKPEEEAPQKPAASGG